ncbi:hypothetical protein HZA76_01380 [Candidatus Roizmanbacteria bacterium]|nr:hypothetical protein [Candidatus Roizmanbacteria bacterium]
MAKGKILEDTFEQLAELGVSSAKKTVKSVAQTLNPFDKPSETQNPQNQKTLESLKKSKNHTPLDFDNLKNKFQDKEKLKAEALRNRLFQMVKQGDEKLMMEKRQKELEKKRQEVYLEEEKKRKDEEKKRQQAAPMPTGKIRRSIFSSKKTAEQQHAETKPATGKQ